MPPPESVLPAIVWDHADEVLALEQAAARAATSSLRARLAELYRTFAARWTKQFGSLAVKVPDSPELRILRGDLAMAISAVTLDPHEVLLVYAHRAVKLGVRQAAAEAGARVAVLASPGIDVLSAIDAGAFTAGRHLAEASRLAVTSPGDTFHTAVGIPAARANRAVTSIESAATWSVHRGVATGAGAVADELGARLLWLAERDACLSCLGLSGHFTGTHGAFDENLSGTFTGKTLSVWPDAAPLSGPPLHPRCRCRVTPWLGAVAVSGELAGEPPAIGGLDLPDALQREARRSVVKGWALDSEPARLRAADLLLARGARLPETVEAAGRAAVARGGFDHPTTKARP